MDAIPSGVTPQDKLPFLADNFTRTYNDSMCVNTSTCDPGPCHNRDKCLQEVLDYIYPSPFAWTIILLYMLVFIVGLVGNFLVCFSVWRNPSMRTVTNYFIVNLAVADFLVILMCLPPTAIEDVAQTWYMGRIMCKIIKYMQGVSVSVSVFTLSCISVERFYAICRPLSFKATPRRARWMIIITWTVALTLQVPELVSLETHRNPNLPADFSLLTTCKPSWSSEMTVGFMCFHLVALYLLPLMLMFVTYLQIARTLWSTSIPTENSGEHLNASSHGGGAHGTENHLHGRRKAAKMLIVVVLMFSICYLPVHLLNILGYAKALDSIGEYITIFALSSHWLCYFNSAINPVIYNYMSAKFRKEFRNACSCCYSQHSSRRCVNNAYTYKYSHTQDSHKLHGQMSTTRTKLTSVRV